MTANNTDAGTPGSQDPSFDFSLPGSSGKQGSGAYRLLVVLVALNLVLVAVLLAAALFSGGAAKERPATPAADLEAMKKLALRLEARGMPERSARAWADYIEAADLDRRERGQKLAHAAKKLQDAGKYEDAIVFYFRADQLDPSEEVKAAINKGVHECFTRLGKYSASFYELADRTSLGSEEVPDGSTIVAEIGPEKITLRDFEGKLDEEIEKMTAGMTGAQAEQYTKYLRQQYTSVDGKQRKLGEIVGREVLAREAKERKIDQSESFKKRLAEIADQLQAQQVLQAELDKVNLSENDYKLYYEANKAEYKEPEKAGISRILLDDEKAAEELLKTLKTPEDFAKAAKGGSLDAQTKEKGGEVDGEVRPGSWVPGIGSNKELNEAIFAVKGGTILDKVFKTDDGFNLVMVREKTPERQKSYEEVKDQVKREYDTQKQREVTDALIRSLFGKYRVVLHPGVFAGEWEKNSQEDGEPAASNDEKESR